MILDLKLYVCNVLQVVFCVHPVGSHNACGLESFRVDIKLLFLYDEVVFVLIGDYCILLYDRGVVFFFL